MLSPSASSWIYSADLHIPYTASLPAGMTSVPRPTGTADQKSRRCTLALRQQCPDRLDGIRKKKMAGSSCLRPIFLLSFFYFLTPDSISYLHQENDVFRLLCKACFLCGSSFFFGLLLFFGNTLGCFRMSLFPGFFLLLG